MAGGRCYRRTQGCLSSKNAVDLQKNSLSPKLNPARAHRYPARARPTTPKLLRGLGLGNRIHSGYKMERHFVTVMDTLNSAKKSAKYLLSFDLKDE